jgi:hypothetical protein
MVGSVDGRVVECSSVVANRATDRAITTPIQIPRPRTSTPPVDGAHQNSPRNPTAQKNAIKNTTSNTSLARSANAEDQNELNELNAQNEQNADQNADRPQRAGAGVAEWG